MIDYQAPTPDDLRRLKHQLQYSGEQMAELAGVAGSQQWRKYTSGATPRGLNLHILFFISARLSLSEDQLATVLQKMQEIGGSVELPGGSSHC